MDKNTKIGFIGTGVMGKAMCLNIMNAGYKNISVYNRTKSKADELIENGASWCDSVEEVAINSDVIFSIVGYPKDVEETYLGEKGIINSAKEGTIIVDMTTSEPTLAKKIYDSAKEKNISSLDAPVTGGDLGAKNGTLSIFVGGEEDSYNKIKPILDSMGKSVALMGDSGAGQHSKMANQISIASNIAGTVETLLYAKKANLDLNKVLELVGAGSAASWQFSNMGGRITKGDFEPGFYIKHFVKDMKIAIEESEKMGLDLQVLKLVKSFYDKAMELGYEDLGTQGLYKVLDEISE
jgi:3-hydroxyisobutyrate dehydrogenase